MPAEMRKQLGPQAEQTWLLFDSMLKVGQAWFTAKEIAGLVSVDEKSIHNAFFSKSAKRQLMGFGFNFDGEDLRIHKRIPRAMLLCWLIKNSNFDLPILCANFDDMVANLTPVARKHLRASLDKFPAR